MLWGSLLPGCCLKLPECKLPPTHSATDTWMHTHMSPCILDACLSALTTAAARHNFTPDKSSAVHGGIMFPQQWPSLLTPLSLPATVVLIFSAWTVVNNELSATLPTGPSAEKAALLVIPAVCYLAAAPERGRLHRSKEAAEHTLPPHRGYTGLCSLSPPPSLSLLPIPSLSCSTLCWASSERLGCRRTDHRLSTSHWGETSRSSSTRLPSPPAWGCRSSDRDGRGWSACRFCVCVSACRANQTPGDPQRAPDVLRPAPAPKTVPSVWIPGPFPRASHLESSLCESTMCVVVKSIFFITCIKFQHYAGRDGYTTDVTLYYVMMCESLVVL